MGDNKLEIPRKLSHKQWRAHIKKEKRKAKRQALAKFHVEQSDPADDVENAEVDGQEILQQEKQRELQRIAVHEQWIRKDQEAHVLWLAQQERKAQEQAQKEEEERRIREEWEERERKEREEQESKEKAQKDKKDHQDALLKEAISNENQGEGPWHNPLAPPNYSAGAKEGKMRESCSFFAKTGVCRFGDRCSRAHHYPESSCTLLLPGMYASFLLEQSLVDEYDTDLALEYDEGEMYQHFKDFYNDVLPEFRAVGRVRQFKVSCNFEPHLRGNVYVQFEREENAQKAMIKFNARYYAGKQLNCEFTTINSWKQAICGLHHKQQCPKGKNCNFLHVFRNPSNEFAMADRDFLPYNNSYRSQRGGGGSTRRHSRSRSRSRSPPRSVRSRRSRSRSPSYRRSKRQYSYRRDRSRSPMEERARPLKSSKRKYSPSDKQSSGRSQSPDKYEKARRSRSDSGSPEKQSRSVHSKPTHVPATEGEFVDREGSGEENGKSHKSHKHKKKKKKHKKSRGSDSKDKVDIEDEICDNGESVQSLT